MNERDSSLAVDLRHILDLFSQRAGLSRWLASNVWTSGQELDGASSELERLADCQTFIAGERLSVLAHAIVQVTDGEFSAFEGVSDSPWVIIRAGRLSYKVFSPERAVLDRIRVAFQRVSDCDFAR